MNEKNEELKNWDVTFVGYRREVIKAKTKAEAWTIAEKHRLPNERVGPFGETDEEADVE